MSLYVRGNDDIWIFVNGQRVIDLGGIHNPLVRIMPTEACCAVRPLWSVAADPAHVVLPHPFWAFLCPAL